MSVFEDDKHLCSWCGQAPANNESTGKKKSIWIAKAGAYLEVHGYCISLMVKHNDN